MSIQVGDVFKWQRTFADDEISQFGELTGDKGNHHIERDEKGRLMAHGLLTASIGTKIGGDLNYIARQMVCEYIRPVFSGDTITCELTLTKVEKKEGFTEVAMQTIYKNQHGKDVLVGSSYGMIRD